MVEAALDGARPLLPACGVGQPVGAMGDIGPGPDARDPVGERLDIALDIVEPGDLFGVPTLRNAAVAFAKMAIEARDEAAVMLRPGLAEIGPRRIGVEMDDLQRRVYARVGASGRCSHPADHDQQQHPLFHRLGAPAAGSAD